MSQTPKWVARFVTLNAEQMERGAKTGRGREASALRAGRKGQYGADALSHEQSLDQHYPAAQAELAVSLLLNLPWTGEPVLEGDLPQGLIDVGTRIDVRMTDHWSGHLLVHDNDADEGIFVLVVYDHKRPNRFAVIGWLYGHECKKREWWRKERENGWAYFVPQWALRDMFTLPENA